MKNPPRFRYPKPISNWADDHGLESHEFDMARIWYKRGFAAALRAMGRGRK